jgi:hypothetical protein
MESNIHLVPTDKPSRLFKNIKGNLGFNTEWTEIPFGRINQNIYITDNSEIRDWWVFNTQTNKVYFVKGFYGVQAHAKKIILTNDIDLIQGGIQSINDEFLQWFVKNPSCKRVEVEKWTDYRLKNNEEIIFYNYKIIIPQEEPKQTDENGKPITYWGGLETPKQETLEEAAEKYARMQCEDLYDNEGLTGFNWGWETSLDFINGAKSNAAKDYWYKKFWDDYESQFKNQADEI